MLLFSTARYAYLAERLADVMRRPLGRVERKTFPDGELYHRIEEDVDGQHAVLVGGTISEADSLAGKRPVEGKATAYVCIGHTCSAPITDAEALAFLLHHKRKARSSPA